MKAKRLHQPADCAHPELSTEIDSFSMSQTLFNPESILYVEDKSVPVQLENESVKGGTAILKYQAACPFRAFAPLSLIMLAHLRLLNLD